MKKRSRAVLTAILVAAPSAAVAALAASAARAPGARAAARSRSGGPARPAGAAPVDGMGAIRVGGVDLDTVTIPELQAHMARGSLSSVRLTLAYLRRIRSVDPRLNAVLHTSPTALGQAVVSDARRRLGRTRGPLDGIPVLLKDNIDTRDMPTTAGSLALAGKPPRADAELVARLRAGGAVLLGKANLSEWANFRSMAPTSGWSAVGGQTRNPYVLDRSPCGSSAGSAAALAASLAQVAIGTETDGSIVCPAGMNAVVGLKPSLGVVSRSGVVPVSAEQDTAGPMARTVIDAALTLSVIGGVPVAPDFAEAATRPGALRGRRIGLWRMPLFGAGVDALMTRTAERLREAGVDVVEVWLPHQLRMAELEFPCLLSEFHRDINAYLATRNGPRDLAELIEFNRTHPRERTCFADQELFEEALAAPPATDPEYRAMRTELKDLARRSVDEVMAEHGLDAIASPANPPAWTIDCARGDAEAILSSKPAAVAGYPSLSVPAGFVGELPVGLLLTAGDGRDAHLLSLGAAVEHHLAGRRAPRYLPTLPADG
ncbi:amidase family protein [Streptomyces termitum]|uniref:amidase family protein n=1 Tax=Streptomyces termitum TaxID=67368 RepID=UPI00379F3BDF